MPSIEETAKARFAKVFKKADWPLFKHVADVYLERSARLRNRDMSAFPGSERLRARNIEKRLFLGLGTELLLKAVYLKHGFAINKIKTPKALGAPSFPFTWAQVTAAGMMLKPDTTYMLHELIQQLYEVPAIGALGELEPGLQIAKVFRNKEGHGVVAEHDFNAQEYTRIETALVGVYKRGFEQTLRVTISMKPGQKAVWKLS